ncbi:hypothetical protein Ddye_010449 [Dipteronia dyeriana]|uniref:RPW8 domain-containing protein n=1 Tax=Dipteronia dyeriana TaxID=168575 RepID=A0AAD9XDP6_9ROSI|nr:hypothetical protein Ddye_010449 [Dipteronia dyeriana]
MGGDHSKIVLELIKICGENTVKLLAPKINEIEHKEEIVAFDRQLVKAKELVFTCSEIPSWNLIKQYRLLNVEFQDAQCHDILKTLAEVTKMNQKLDEMNFPEKDGDTDANAATSINHVKTVIKFKPILENLRRNVQSLSQNIKRITQLQESADELQNQIGRLVLLLKEAEELIEKCSRIAWWNYFKKYRYSKKLIELDASLSGASKDFLAPICVDILLIRNEIVKLSRGLESVLHERNAHGWILKRSKTKVVYLASGLKKIVQSIPSWIYPYLSWLLGIHRRGRGYQRFGG